MEETKNKVIGIFTTFYSFDSAYSLVSVVRDQLVMNVRHGYKTVLFVLPSFKDDDKVPAGVEVRKVIPQITLEKYKSFGSPPDFKDDVKQVVQALIENASDIDIMIAHDMHFIDTYLPYCGAIHDVCQYDLIKAKWLLWTHSAPSPRQITEGSIHNLRFQLPRNAKLVYLNNYHTLHLAEMYGTWLSEVRVVPNSVDFSTFYNFHPLVNQLIDKYDLLSADYMGVYPLSSTRMIDGKQVQKAVKLMSKIKAMGYNVKYIIANAHGNAQREKDAIKSLQEMFMGWGLNGNEIIFTSFEEVPQYESGVSREIVSQLFQLSNIFIFPTVSENCSLVLLEAKLSKNLLVLNADVPQLREFGKENALYMSFSGKDSKTTYNNEEQYYEDWAKIVDNQMQQNKSLLAQRDVLKHNNLKYIFTKFLEPLYYD